MEPKGEFKISCLRCFRTILARREWIGREVECPHCHGAMRVPAPGDGAEPAKAESPTLTAKRRFNFACGKCESLLEATTGMCGREGKCPTCGCGFIVPHLDARGRPERTQMLNLDEQDPTPVHAYAASGEQAPRIVRNESDEPYIECGRCGVPSPIDADHCPSCGAPFTLEGAPTARSEEDSGYATASLVLGIISLVPPICALILPGIGAIVLALLSMRGRWGRRKSKLAIAGLIMGLVSLFGSVFVLAQFF